MPLFAVHALDKPNTLQLRMDHYPAHRAFLEAAETHGVAVVLSGPLQSDDGEVMIGSLFLVDATDRETIQAFIQADPFYTVGLWDEITISRFHRRRG